VKPAPDGRAAAFCAIRHEIPFSYWTPQTKRPIVAVLSAP